MSVQKTVEVKVPGYSGFDKSHRVSTTLKCGQITPILVDELIPGTKVNLKLDLAAQLPPLVSDTFMNVKLRSEAFFVPSRILCKSFESFYADFEQEVYGKSANTSFVRNKIKGSIPYFVISNDTFQGMKNTGLAGPGSLLDYVGFNPEIVQGAVPFNLLPLVAYHLIYQEWYRNPRIQVAPFAESFDSNAAALRPIFSAPFTFYHSAAVESAEGASFPSNVKYLAVSSMLLADGVSVFGLRQRNFPLDFYTQAMVSAQQGDPVFVRPSTESQDGSFSISALRALNSIQQFKERNNIPSSRMIDQTEARYGVRMSDGVAQRPLCLGSAEYDIYSKGIDQTATVEDTGSNPFNSVGSQYGRAYASGSDFIIDNFECKEPGYLFVMVTLVPSVSYAFGVSPLMRRYLSDGSITDMANPLLQNVGNEPIYSSELSVVVKNQVDDGVFGYRERYGAWKDMPNKVHGLLLEGENLESFVLQRSIDEMSTINSAFLQIPQNYMDQVFVASARNMGFAAWFDSHLSYKVAMPLAKYSIPSLQDPAYEHGRTISLRKNGQIF